LWRILDLHKFSKRSAISFWLKTGWLVAARQVHIGSQSSSPIGGGGGTTLCAITPSIRQMRAVFCESPPDLRPRTLYPALRTIH
jgi:hypothetical protein